MREAGNKEILWRPQVELLHVGRSHRDAFADGGNGRNAIRRERLLAMGAIFGQYRAEGAGGNLLPWILKGVAGPVVFKKD